MIALRIVERELEVYRRTWRGSVFSGFVSPILYLGAIGIGLGGLVDERQSSVDGLSYLDFVTPGLLAAGAMQGAAGNALWPIMAGTKWMRFFHGMVATPISPADVATGVILWNAVRATVYTTAFFLVAALLGGVGSFWGVIAIPMAVLGAIAFAAPFAAFAATQETDMAFAVLMRLVVLPLFLFSGAFFPLDQLPESVQPVAWLSPLWHATEVCRGATTGTLVAGDLGHALVLAAVIFAGWRWAQRTFTARLAP